MAQKPTAPRVMNGKWGMIYWDGEPIFEVSKFEAKLKLEREDLDFAMQMASDSKMTGYSGEFSFTIKKIFSRGQIKFANAIKQGRDIRCQLIGKLSDPDAYGSERLVLNNCWFSDLVLMSFESSKTLEEEFSGGFTDFDFPDLVKVR
ncbi:MAG: phage tail tube protein [Firmicutes bacterium]|nr:phage tail tube protein [Bacillota bacterium]